MSYCPECEAVIDEEVEDLGEIVSCPECGVELEVVSVDPVEFDLAPVDDEEGRGDDEEFEYEDSEEEEEEDWEDEDEEYDEDEEKEEY